MTGCFPRSENQEPFSHWFGEFFVYACVCVCPTSLLKVETVVVFMVLMWPTITTVLSWLLNWGSCVNLLEETGQQAELHMGQ